MDAWVLPRLCGTGYLYEALHGIRNLHYPRCQPRDATL
ncbi:hypothetical protein FHX81_2318 [Saccharothrix saharensis]|uniref:Uncharacterized protein n=1 Tax=Saccharothrix saharensis TaxID=571190 RepID=A0A543JAY5_9PSEU|nr:hypothetical protein FHX81_2318 [Saccharothrix saharensis]